jgi:hypothetical protein
MSVDNDVIIPVVADLIIKTTLRQPHQPSQMQFIMQSV